MGGIATKQMVKHATEGHNSGLESYFNEFPKKERKRRQRGDQNDDEHHDESHVFGHIDWVFNAMNKC